MNSSVTKRKAVPALLGTQVTHPTWLSSLTLVRNSFFFFFFLALLEKSSFPDQALNRGPGSESLNPWTTPVILFFFFFFILAIIAYWINLIGYGTKLEKHS